MPDYTPHENMLWALKDIVMDNLEARLIAIQAEKDDAISLPIFSNYQMGYTDWPNATRFPYVMFVGDVSNIEPSANQAEWERFTAHVIVVLQHTKRDELTKMELRYADAVRGVINENETLGGVVILAQVTSIAWFPAADNTSLIDIRVEMLDEVRT